MSVLLRNEGGQVIRLPVGKALRGTAPGEALHVDYVTMFEGEGLLVLKDGFSGFVMLWDTKYYNAGTTEDSVVEWAALFGDRDCW